MLKKKRNKGITLIALIVTIVVLLILAGVSIATLTGENGILKQASKAKEETHIAQDKELIQLAVNEYNVSKYSEPSKSLKDILQQQEWCSNALYNEESKEIIVIIKECEHQYSVSENGSVTKIEGTLENINLVRQDTKLWQYGNNLTETTNIYSDVGHTRLSLKPEEWIKVNKGEKYTFEYHSETYKVAYQVHNGISSVLDSGWLEPDKSITFIPEASYINLVVCEKNGGNIKLSTLSDLKIALSKGDTAYYEPINNEIIQAGSIKLDRDKVISGLLRMDGSIQESLVRASYSEIINVSDLYEIYLYGDIFKSYDVALLTSNKAGKTLDYGWISKESKIVLEPYTELMIICFRDKGDATINYNNLLYGNDFIISKEKIDYISRPKEETNPLLDSEKVLQIAHRGAPYAFGLPENSIPAFIKACEIGFDGIEADLQCTQDGVFVIMHDETVNSTTNGTGTIADMTYEQISNLVLTHNSNCTDEEAKVPTLDDVLQICKRYNKIPFLEIKQSSISESVLDILYDKLVEYDMLKKVVLISFNNEALSYMRKKSDLIHVQPLGASINYTLCYTNSSLSLETHLINSKIVSEAHEKGLLVNCFTVNEQKTAEEMISAGVDMITSNYYFKEESNR